MITQHSFCRTSESTHGEQTAFHIIYIKCESGEIKK